MASEATRPATKTATSRILSFMRGLLRGWRRPCRPRRSPRQKPAPCGEKPPERVRAALPSRPPPPEAAPSLLHLDAGAGLLELTLDRVRLFARHALLHRLRRRVDEVLRLLQAQAGDRADDLDHLDLLVAGAREHDVERRLLLGRAGAV